ncbi:MAG: ABC transporter permease, partial [Lawsonibacter sp.]
MLTILTSGSFWFSVLASTTPVMLATIAANILTKSGVFNLGIEGTMLICALSGVLVSAYTSSLFFGALFGVLMGILISFMLGYFTLILNAPMNACGVAINLLASGGTVFVLATLTGSKVTSAALKSLTFPTIHIPFIRDIPFLGPILSGHPPLTYLAFLTILVMSVLMYRTKFGVHLRVVGENEDAAISLGLNTARYKTIAILLGSLCCAFAGINLSLERM